MTKLISTIAGCLALASHAGAFFILPCSGPVLVERADPIVNPGTVSGHAHTIMGGSGFNFTMDYDSAVASSCSTCKVKQDLSNYWTPNLYYQRQDGKFETVPQAGGMLVYYLQRQDPKDIEYKNGLVAFPEGFQMLAGNPMLRSYNETLEQKAISFACLGVKGPETPGIPNYNCPNGLRAQIVFPSCWDGKNLDSANHKSHMAYPSRVNNGVCPPSHPKRMATLFFEVLFKVNDFKDKWYNKDAHPFVFSNGDPTGFGFHGDFLNGWDVSVLQKALKTCTSNSGDIKKCEVFDFFEDETMRGCRVPNRINEPVSGVLDKLPGCNTVQKGPGAARAQSGCGATTTIGPSQLPYTDVTKTKGYKYVGCARDANGRPRTLNDGKQHSDQMTIDYCVDYCSKKGFKFAGTEYGRECYCGNDVAADRAPVKGVMGVCNMPCKGNAKEVCGGSGGLSLYEKCEKGKPCANAEL